MSTLDTRPVATAVTLTGSYVTQSKATHSTADYIELGENTKEVSLFISYTMGAAETGNSVEIKVEFATPLANDLPVAADWAQPVTDTVTPGVITGNSLYFTLTAVNAAGTPSTFTETFCPNGQKFMRFSFKETSIAANGGTLTLRATLVKE